MLEMTSRLLQDIGALILAFLVYFELKTGLVLTSFALYDDYSHVIQTVLLVMGPFVLQRFVHLFQRRQHITQLVVPFNSSPYALRRSRTPEFPPGIEFNRVQERWNGQGMERPLMERREFGASRPAEVPPVQRSVLRDPIVASQLPQSDERPINASFGKIRSSEHTGNCLHQQ